MIADWPQRSSDPDTLAWPTQPNRMTTMDSLFDDDSENVGSEIEAFCPSPRCKTDTNHTVVSMYEEEIRRVQCQVCGDVHAFRKPRGEGGEAGPEDLPTRKGRLSKKPTWSEA